VTRPRSILKTNGHLVTQYLEKISRKALEDNAGEIVDFIKGRAGIYALYKGESLYYVGLASNLKSRFRAHLRNRSAKEWDRFSIYLTIGNAHIRELEALILRTMKAAGNKQRGYFRRAEDLRRAFSESVRREQRSMLAAMLGSSPYAEDADEYLDKSYRLIGVYKGRRISATFCKDGTVRLGRRRYSTLSAAAVKVVKRPVNGWTFWKYERAPGDWVKVSTLRE
jgi:hypothetical protein